MIKRACVEMLVTCVSRVDLPHLILVSRKLLVGKDASFFNKSQRASLLLKNEGFEEEVGF